MFGGELSLDLMFLDDKAVPNLVNTATNFSSAAFSDAHGEKYEQGVQGVGLAFFMIWFSAFSGYHNRLCTDQGSVFTSERWKQITDLNGVKLCLSGVNAHSSLRIGEKYHRPHRRIYR